MRKFILYLLIIVVTIVFTLLVPFQKSYAETSQTEINIATSPEKVLFDLRNLKPGDWSQKDLIINNSGKQDFHYLASSKLLQGSEKLYNELLLAVSDKDKIIYNGKLKDFDKLESRFIAKGHTEQLAFKIKVPSEMGNEFQGLECKVEFKFYAEGTLGGLLPVNGPKLPSTGTSAGNILAAGAILFLAGLLLQIYLALRKIIHKHKSLG